MTIRAPGFAVAAATAAAAVVVCVVTLLLPMPASAVPVFVRGFCGQCQMDPITCSAIAAANNMGFFSIDALNNKVTVTGLPSAYVAGACEG